MKYLPTVDHNSPLHDFWNYSWSRFKPIQHIVFIIIENKANSILFSYIFQFHAMRKVVSFKDELRKA